MNDEIPNHYQVLGVAEAATIEQIKGSFARLTSTPEGDRDADLVSRTRVAEAYAVLSNFDRRRAYDRQLAERRRPRRDEALKKVARLPTSTQCHLCAWEPAATVTLRRGVGMLFVRRSTKARQTLCRDCGIEEFRTYQNSTLIRGWWGFISFFMNFYFIAANVRAYFTLRALSEPKRVEGVFVSPRGEPAKKGRPLLARAGLLCAVGALVIAGVYVNHLAHSNHHSLVGLSQNYIVGACVAHSGHDIVGMVNCSGKHFGSIVAIKHSVASCPSDTAYYFVDKSSGPLYHLTVCLKAAA